MKKNTVKLLLIVTLLLSMLILAACQNSPAVVTDGPTSATGATDTPSPTAQSEPTSTPTETPIPATPTPVLPDVSPEDFDPKDFFSDVVYCGDSVLAHFEWQGPYKREDWYGKFSTTNWLVSISNSVRYSLSEENHAEEPQYKGETAKLWKVIPQIGKSRVLMFFGLNDIGPTGVDKFMENYDALINKIKAAAPDVKIYIMSLTPVLAGKEVFHADGSGLNNVNVMEANRRLEIYAKEKGYGYIDVATPFRDENNALKPEYSDGTNVHFKLKPEYPDNPYKLWDEILLPYAQNQLMEEYLDTFR